MVPWCLFCSLNYFQSGQTETFLLIFGALALSMVTRLATYRWANFERAFTSTDGARVIVEFIDIFFFNFVMGIFINKWCPGVCLVYQSFSISDKPRHFYIILALLALLWWRDQWLYLVPIWRAFTSTDGAQVFVVFIDGFSTLSWAFSLTNGARVFV